MIMSIIDLIVRIVGFAQVNYLDNVLDLCCYYKFESNNKLLNSLKRFWSTFRCVTLYEKILRVNKKKLWHDFPDSLNNVAENIGIML